MGISRLLATAALCGALLTAGVLGADGAKATLLTDGDFDSVNQANGFFNADINIDTKSGFNEWHTAGVFGNNNQMWSIMGPGAGGSTAYAMHNTRGDGGDKRLAQIIDASSFAIGKKLTLTFDYLNVDGSATNDSLEAYLIGFESGTYQRNGGGPTGGATATILDSTVPLSTTGSSFTPAMLMGTIDKVYAGVGVVFRASCFVPGGATGQCDGPRGVDNVVLEMTSLPEPGTLALFGLGLAGLGLSARRKRA